MKRFFAIVIVIILSSCFVGCQHKVKDTMASGQGSEKPVVEETYPDEYFIEEDNYFDYQTGLECAAYASAYVLRHSGISADGKELFEDYPGKVWDGGVAPYGIEEFFDNLGYDAEFKVNGTVEELKNEISKGKPIIVFIYVDEPEKMGHNTHYVPLVGYDKEYFYFAESLSGLANCKDEEDLIYNRKTKISEFKKLWKNIDGMWDKPYFVINI